MTWIIPPLYEKKDPMPYSWMWTRSWPQIPQALPITHNRLKSGWIAFSLTELAKQALVTDYLQRSEQQCHKTIIERTHELVSLYMLKWCYHNLALSKIKCDLEWSFQFPLTISTNWRVLILLLYLKFCCSWTFSDTLWSKHVCVGTSQKRCVYTKEHVTVNNQMVLTWCTLCWN